MIRKLRDLRRAGYTLIEVMAAVAVMTVGATGIVMLQGATQHANQDAYEASVALNFANTWIERVKRDALNWRTQGTSPTNLNATKYLQLAQTNLACANQSGWTTPATTGVSVAVRELPTCNQYTIQAERFARAILDDTDVALPLEDSVRNMRVLDAITRAAASGRWESI